MSTSLPATMKRIESHQAVEPASVHAVARGSLSEHFRVTPADSVHRRAVGSSSMHLTHWLSFELRYSFVAQAAVETQEPLRRLKPFELGRYRYM